MDDSSEMSQKMAKEGPRLSKNQKFSEHFSIHCCPPFTFLNSKREIVDRKYSICKSGCFYQKKEEDWICCACQKTRPAKQMARCASAAGRSHRLREGSGRQACVHRCVRIEKEDQAHPQEEVTKDLQANERLQLLDSASRSM
ncbi:Myelin-associated oligodendrocyte basic protein [Galemys pyrenaicus]|uniref:Myelin-associated oligodendrocyte basic protein n=1 Tax=Galemys pyrenaicus TaxID=202257 RepID=A0A8J6AIC4_GALPY|nr:Myelin-associated oligodendrocyte basic protein [Galemys pyrenaicus]